MPISEQVHGILHEGKGVREAVNELFSRALKREKE
jgi:glycerol-3-phosphate dehydrogenase